MNKTKIVATIGPSNNSIEKIEELINCGVDTIRINLKHASKDFCIDTKNKLDLINDKLKSSVALMFDIKVSNVQVGRIHNYEAMLIENTKIRIYMDDSLGDSTKFSVNYKNLINEVNYDTILKIDDGKIKLQVLDKGKDYLLCLVLIGGLLKEKKSINILDVKLDTPFLTLKDKENIVFANKLNVDFLAISYVESHEDILDVNDLLIDLGNDHMSIIAKIENERAYDNIDEIINASDGVMVARGDLGIEVPIERIPGIQKAIINKCQKMGKISIVATEMITSMENNLIPTRAEVSDVANAVIDGTDAILLTGDTTNGTNLVETVKAMEKIISQAELDIDYNDFIDKAIRSENKDITGLIAHNVANDALFLNCKAIFAPTITGYTARKISRFRPICPILAASPDVEIVKSLQLNFGIYPIYIEEIKTFDKIIEISKRYVADKLELNQKDKYIITGGYPFKEVKHTNFMKIEEIK